MVNTIKLLLSSPISPFGPACGDSLSCQTSGSYQLTWAQEIFRVEDHMLHWGLDLMARNIEIPTKVLHYPNLSQFVKEVKKQYEYVGLTFNLATFHKLKLMVKAIRQYAPNSKIILGGYGTVLSDQELEGLGDYICREEGLSYLRKFFHEKTKPFQHPDLIIQRRIFSLNVEKIGIIFSAVGCPYGCDFCCTSNYYKREKTYFFGSAKELYQSIIDFKKRNKQVGSIIIFDDDFLVDKKRALDFLELARQSEEHLNIMVFAGVKSLSQFTAREIAEMGITKVWVGFEGMKAGYEKQEGKPFKDIVSELREYGISATASMMIGFDYQSQDIIRDEFRELIACNPTASQIILVTPCVGTPLWNKLSLNDRLTKDTRNDYKIHDGFTLLFKHPNMSRPEMENLQKSLYQQEYLQLGPSLFRILSTQYQGYLNLRSDANAVMRKRAEASLKILKRALVLYYLGIKFAPDPKVKNKLKKQYHDIVIEVGNIKILMRPVQYLLLPLALWTRIRFKYKLFVQPKYSSKTYNC